VTADCVTLWIGDRMGAVERACLQSVMRQGHGVALYCYRTPDGIPASVELRDAEEILPESKVFTGRNGSFAAFSDWFRYELLERGLGTWVDTDMYLLRPLEMRTPNLFGEESPGIINNAILRLPQNSPMLPPLLAPFDKGRVPRGLTWRQRFPLHIQQIFRGKLDLSGLPWGSTGPLAISALAREFDLASQALPSDVLYPASWREPDWIRDSSMTLEEIITERTVGIHLWNECIKGYKDDPAPAGSFLARLQQQGRE